MRLRDVLWCALLFASIGCAKETKAPPAGPAASAPAPAPAPVAPAPDAGAAPAPAPVKSETQTAMEALTAASTPEATDMALAGLRKALDAAPAAPEFAVAAKAFVTSAVARVGVVAGDVEAVKRVTSLLLDASGAMPAPIRAALGADADGALTVAKAATAAGLEDLEAVAKLAAADGSWKEAAGAVARAKAAPLARAFAPAATPGKRLSQVLALAPAGETACAQLAGGGCDPAFYGLQDVAPIDSLASAAKTVMHLSALARLAGDAAPKGSFDLPLPEGGAAEPKAGVTSSARSLPLETVVLDAAGVHLTLRPVASLDGLALAAGGSWPGEVVLNAEALAAISKDEELKPLVDALTALRATAAAAEPAVFGAAAAGTNGMREKGKWAAMLVVDKATPGKVLRPVLKALDLAGYPDVRWARPQQALGVLAAPSRADAIPQDRWGRAEERPLIVHVKPDSVDVFEARGTGEAPKEEAAVALPAQAKKWYRGKRVAKLQIRGADVGPVVQTVRYLRRESASGTVVVLVPAPDATAERVTEVAAALAAAAGPAPQQKLSDVFPGLVCKDEEPASDEAACQSLFPVVSPDAAVPSSGGMTEQPEEKEKVEKPEPKKPEEIKLGFCDQGDIKRVITSRTGAIKFCYERKLQLDQDLKGNVTVRLTIGADGSVQSASTSGSMPDKSVHECVAKAVRSLKFKAPDGGVCVVNYPFVFKP